MNIARSLCNVRSRNISRNLNRKFRFTLINYESSGASQSQLQEEKFDFEDLKVLERVERRKAKIEPFMKNVFLSIFNKDLLAYSEILNKDETEDLDQRVSRLEKTFSDQTKTQIDRKNALKINNLYGAPVSLTNGGLAMNCTESLRFLETISSDLQLSQEVSDHWVSLHALKLGLHSDQYQKLIGDLITGEKTIALCVKEKVSNRLLQPDFKTQAELDGQGIWQITGEKVCNQITGYFLVLASVESNRLRGFLVHPGAEGISHDNTYVTFRKTPATPLEFVSEQNLAHVLGVSRIYAATLARCLLTQAMNACIEYVRPRFFSGKPLSEISTIQATIGEALIDIYASESAEYFTAGLIDGYMEPEAELEMAMCRNFMANHGLTSVIELLSIPAVDQHDQYQRFLHDMRQLVFRGETLDGVNTFIALNGIHHAGKILSEEIKQIRNPLFHPTFILKKVFLDRHQEKDNPKLTLYLAEHLHPTLRPAAEQLEYCVLRMRYACETLMARHGAEIFRAYTELNRLAEAASEILVMTAVLARASRAYCIGLRNAEVDMKLAACFVEKTRDKVRQLIKDIDDGQYVNLDHFKTQFGKRALELNPTNPTFVEKPIARVFW